MKSIQVLFLLFLFIVNAGCQDFNGKNAPEEKEEEEGWHFSKHELTPEYLKGRKYQLVEVKLMEGKKLLLNGTEASVEEMAAHVHEKFTRIGLGNFEEVLVVQLGNSRKTNYNFYLKVYNQLKEAYQNAKNQLAQKKFNNNYEALGDKEKKSISKRIPLMINEAEPDF